MSNEVNNLTVKLSIDATQAQKGANQFNQALQSIVKSADAAGKSMEKLNKGYKDAGEASKSSAQQQQQAAEKIKMTQAQYDSLQKKLLEYQNQLKASIEEEKRLQAQINEVNNSMKRATAQFSSFNAEAGTKTKGIPQIIAELQKVADEQIRLVTGIGETEKALANADVGGREVPTALANMGFAAGAAAADLAGKGGLADALRIAGEAVSTFMKAGGSGPGLAIAGISAAFSVIGLIVEQTRVSVEAHKAKLEGMRNSFNESSASAYGYTGDVRAADSALKVLGNAGSTTDELRAANATLAQQFPELIVGYNQYGDAILAGNKVIQQRIDKLKEEQSLNDKQILQTGAATIDDSLSRKRKNIDELAKLSDDYDKKLIEVEKLREELKKENPHEGAVISLPHDESELYDLKAKIDATKHAMDSGDAELGQFIQDYLFAAIRDLPDVSEAQLAASRALILENIEKYKDELESAASDIDVSNKMNGFVEGILPEIGPGSERVTAMMEEMKGSADDLGKSYETLAQKLSLAQRMQDVNRLKAYVDVLKNGDKNTKEWGEASAEIAKRLGITETELQKNIKGYSGLVLKLDDVTEAEYDAMIAAIDLEIASLHAQIAMGDMSIGAVEAILHSVEELRTLKGEMQGVAEAIGEDKQPRSGGGSPRKAAWEEELELIDRVRSEMDDLGEVYIAVLEKMAADQRLSAEERKRVEKELEYANKAVAGTLQEDYIAYLEKILETQKLSADQRLDVERRLIEAQKQLAQERIEAEQQLIAELDALGNAVAEALRRRYEAEKTMQEEALAGETERVRNAAKEQIAAINATRDARIAALNAEIRALDDAWKARQRIKEDETDEKRLVRLRTQMELEKDVYNQQKLQEQIAQVEAGMTEREAQRTYQDAKQRLQDEIATVRDSAQQQIDTVNATLEADLAAFEARKEAQDAYWKERVDNEQLQLEALYILNNESNEDILQLLQDYNPEYLQAGLDMGQMLYDGFSEKYDDLLERTKEVAGEIISQANAAMDAWREMQSVVGGGSSGSSSSSGLSAGRFTASPMAFTLLEIPDLIQAASISAMERMVEAPRAYYAQKEQEAYAAGASTFALADIGRAPVSVPMRQSAALTDQQRITGAGYSAKRFDSLVVNIQPPLATSAYEVMRAARLELEKLNQMGLI